jgi:NTP pyrophosphatase (non-canonical NTP hydrolase)
MRAKETAIYQNTVSESGHIPYCALGLTGEAGEVSENVKKLLRDDSGILTPSRKQALEKELGDVLWYLANLASEVGISLETIASNNLQKLLDRQQRGVLQGDGDNR